MKKKSFYFEDYTESDLINNNNNFNIVKISLNRVTFLSFIFFSLILIFSIKIIYLSLGWVCVGLAFIGIFIPGIPTTPFLILALWAFAKSSKKFHTWLLNHPRFGPILRNWESHKVVPKKAKLFISDISDKKKISSLLKKNNRQRYL